MYKELIDGLKEYGNGLAEIINPIIKQYPNLKESRIIELNQIAQFLLCINPNIRFIDKPEPPSPDFIISLDGKKIGIEHTRIHDADTLKVKKYHSVVNLIEHQAADKFKRQYPNMLYLVNFFLRGDSLDIKAAKKNNMVDQINGYLICKLNSKICNKPDFIDYIEIMPHSQLSFSFIENNFIGGKLSYDRLKKEIVKKEKRLDSYRTKENLDEYWLVLMTGSLNSVSLQIDSSINYSTQSTFDKVYIKSDFDNQIIKVHG